MTSSCLSPWIETAWAYAWQRGPVGPWNVAFTHTPPCNVILNKRWLMMCCSVLARSLDTRRRASLQLVPSTCLCFNSQPIPPPPAPVSTCQCCLGEWEQRGTLSGITLYSVQCSSPSPRFHWQVPVWGGDQLHSATKSNIPPPCPPSSCRCILSWSPPVQAPGKAAEGM